MSYPRAFIAYLGPFSQVEQAQLVTGKMENCLLQLLVQGIAASRRQSEFQKGKRIRAVREWSPGSPWKYSKWERLEKLWGVIVIGQPPVCWLT